MSRYPLPRLYSELKYQPLRKTDSKSSSFLQHPSQECKVGRTIESSGCTRKGLGNNLAWECLVSMPQFFNPAKCVFRSSNIVCQALLQFSNLSCSAVYSFPVISRTWILVGWCGVLYLINTDYSISVINSWFNYAVYGEHCCILGILRSKSA